MLSIIYSCGCKCTIRREMTIICCIKPCQTYWITMRHFDLAEDHGIHLYGILALVPKKRSRSLQTAKMPLSFPINEHTKCPESIRVIRVCGLSDHDGWTPLHGHWEEVFVNSITVNIKNPQGKWYLYAGMSWNRSTVGLDSYQVITLCPTFRRVLILNLWHHELSDCRLQNVW